MRAPRALLLALSAGCAARAPEPAVISAADLWLVGDAARHGEAARLTADRPSAGAAWWGEAGAPSVARAVPPVGFELELELRLSLSNDDGFSTPADGFALVWLDLERADRFVVDYGSGLGYSAAERDPPAADPDELTGLPGWAVELDTYPNLIGEARQAAEGQGPHVALVIDGDALHPVTREAAPLFRDALKGHHRLYLRSADDGLTLRLDGAQLLHRADWRPRGAHGLLGITSGTWATPHLIVDVLGGQYTDLRTPDSGDED